ncbi:hypothetical protein [Actinomadura sp. 9N215]|uniref:hypothetical protein n=1 Tax=Actinomadura sp. 9N215 TaxID=3375150 RepID=UPI003798D7EF
MNEPADRDSAAGPAQTITIEIEPGDDPYGLINGLVMSDKFIPWLTVYGNATYFSQNDVGEDEMYFVLARFGSVANRGTEKIGQLMVIARDQYGMSWGRIATALDKPRTTVKRHITNERRSLANAGIWYDANGEHKSESTTAMKMALARESHEND